MTKTYQDGWNDSKRIYDIEPAGYATASMQSFIEHFSRNSYSYDRKEYFKGRADFYKERVLINLLEQE